MATYRVRQGEGFSDFVLNSCGDITAWSDCLNANFLASWTPQLFDGQILQIPDNTNTNVDNIAELAIYPANNFSVANISEQINAIFELMQGLTPIPSDGVLPTIDTNVYYFVREHEYIGDVVMNATGDIQNWSAVLDGNFFNEWVPPLYAGQKIAIPSTVNMNLNNFRALNQYPANNFSVPDIFEQINAIFELMNGDPWILATGRWRGHGIWTAKGIWKTV